MKDLYLQNIESTREFHIAQREFILGRDCLLQCNDNRISRKHGIIYHEGNNDTVIIKSTHVNPIYYKKVHNDAVSILKQDEENLILQTGDKFALLPDQFWYLIQIKDEISKENGELPNGSECGIRVREVSEINSTAHIVDSPSLDDRISLRNEEPEEENRVSTNEAENGPSIQNEHKRKSSTENEDAAEKKPKITDIEHSSDNTIVTSTDDIKPNLALLNEPPMPLPKIEPTDDSELPSTSSGLRGNNENGVTAPIKVESEDKIDKPAKPLRDSCQFGIRCYRRNADHRAEFAHPKDPDYRRPSFPANITPIPSAPMCQYGSTCYRRNPEHFRHYKHPDPNAEPEVESSSTESSFDDNDDMDDYGYDEISSDDDTDYSLYASSLDDSDLNGVDICEGGEMEE